MIFQFNDQEKRIFWASVLLLFGEILAIRWLGIEIPTIQAFPNLVLLVVLVSASAGLGSPQKYATKVPIVLASLCCLLLPLIFSVPLGIWTMSMKTTAASMPALVGSIVFLLAIVASLLALFVNVGKVLGEGFSGVTALRGYAINLLGSIAGVVLVALLSLLQSPPPVWLILCGVLCWQIVRSKFVPIVTAIFVVAACTTTLSSMWSPYSKLDIIPLDTSSTPMLGAGNYNLNSNNHYFHAALHILDEGGTRKLESAPDTGQRRSVQHYYDFLRIPFACAPKHSQVLVLGGGSGNDVSYAIRHGADHVDAVEIDPIICRLGKEAHPDRPYLDPKVTIHNEDARTFLRYSKDKFDVIEFAYLDPGNTLNTSSFVRVDNFVYTAQSIKSALNHLNDHGLLTISFATGGAHPVTRRLYQTISEAYGKPPITYVDDKWESVLFLAGPAADTLKINPNMISGLRAWPKAGELTESRPSTDDWPFLYLEYDASGTILYFGILFISVIFPALLLTKSPTGDITSGAWGNMFLLGQAFMLVETKSITQLSLFFGATWLVSSVVIAFILVLACAANWCAGRLKDDTSITPFYLALGVALLVDFFFHIPASSEMNPALLATLSTFIGCFPIFFGGLIFSLCFRKARNPAQYLSANLLGVALGGLTENLCLATGIKGLILVAMLLYGLSYLCFKMHQRQSKAATPSPQLSKSGIG